MFEFELSKGKDLSEHGLFDEAIDLYNKIISHDLTCVAAYIGLGQVMFRLGRSTKAKSYFQKAIEFDPRSALAYHLLGDLSLTDKEYSNAADFYRKAIELDSSNAWSHCNLARALTKMERFSEALKFFESAKSLDSDIVNEVDQFEKELEFAKSYKEQKLLYQENIPLNVKPSESITLDYCIEDPQGNVFITGCFHSGFNPETLGLFSESGTHIKSSRVFPFAQFDISTAQSGLLGFFAFIPASEKQPWPKKINLDLGNGDVFELNVKPQQPKVLEIIDYLLQVYSLCISTAESLAGKLEEIDQTFKVLINNFNTTADKLLHIEQERIVGSVNLRPLVSIVIPVFRNYQLVFQQILEFSRDIFLRDQQFIFVLDSIDFEAENPAPEIVLRSLEAYMGLYSFNAKILVPNHNSGFARACNFGAQHADGKYVLFLNSDIFPKSPQWLESYVSCLDENHEIGVLGGRLLYPEGSIQHLGLSWRKSHQFSGIYENFHPYKGASTLLAPQYSIFDCHAVTGACLMMRKNEFASLGMFSSGYVRGDYEDSDLCLRVRRELDKKVACDCRVSLVHFENSSYPSQSRMAAYRFNLLRHHENWNESIRNILESNQLNSN